MKKNSFDIFFDKIFIWIPSIVTFCIFLYNVISRGEIRMVDWKTLSGAVIAAIIAAGVAIWKENRNSKTIIEKIKERHTLSQAHEYHELTMKEFESLDKEFESFDKEFQRSEKRDDDLSKLTDKISTDIKLMSKDLENHILNAQEVRLHEPDLASALKIFEAYTQKLGEVQRENESLKKELHQLKNDLVMKDKKIEMLIEQKEELETEIKEMQKDDLNNDEISL